MDSTRAVTLLYVVAALAGGILLRSASLQFMGFQSMEDPVLFGLFTATTLFGVLGAVGTFFALSRNAKATEFTGSAWSELSKVTWPSREETLNNTGIVVGASIGFGALMFVYDYSWSAITTFALYSGVGN
jgi:preprotein translocase SecE subunit